VPQEQEGGAGGLLPADCPALPPALPGGPGGGGGATGAADPGADGGARSVVQAPMVSWAAYGLKCSRL
jgi:hypothetical protein